MCRVLELRLAGKNNKYISQAIAKGKPTNKTKRGSPDDGGSHKPKRDEDGTAPSSSLLGLQFSMKTNAKTSPKTIGSGFVFVPIA